MTWAQRHPTIPVLLALLVAVTSVWAVKITQLAFSSGSNAEYWSQPRGATGGLLYVALGDSAAQSIGARDPQHGYVALLADRLRRTTGQPIEVINLSKSGARIHDVLNNQLPALDALRRNPDIVTVAIGGNDIRAYDRTTFAAAAGKLAATLPAGTYMADAPYFMHGHYERHAAQAAALLRQEATDQGLHPVALHDALQRQGWQAMLTQFAADWFHPNDQGHAVWADAFWREMSKDAARL